ncbi:hypothetical protein A2567_02320 [Candidatus Azambacteria bacterium RIFOXYD1_FULL_42_11]|uniref:Uncharacterized protein n=1 Tax=Candidatus Azambacteria bacterium RIFOXYD1_FULL_42_11 TaxID=1797310 RepID=A0A1F5CK68_9BACT|nr:MAG: hypothetical protein A2567_02320 [Candidatus Azambacteria bacterium RIFOXYD1_FULL_42_11]
MFLRNNMGGRKNTLREINYNVYILLIECLKVVKKLLLSPTQGGRRLSLREMLELSTGAEFNVKL